MATAPAVEVPLELGADGLAGGLTVGVEIDPVLIRVAAATAFALQDKGMGA